MSKISTERGAVLDRSRVDIIVEFVEWDKYIHIMDHDISFQNIMDVTIPVIRIPVRPNQMTTIIEVIARRFLFEENRLSNKAP